MGEVLQPGSRDDQRFFHAAAEIAGQLVTRQCRARDGSLYWSGPGLRAGEVATLPLGPYLYPGTTGVALFLAAMERTSGGGEYRDLCLQALAPLRREIPEAVGNPARAQAAVHLGGMSGLGSLVYALLKIGILLGEPALIRDAQDLSGLITPGRILEDESLDVMFGAAGALLALLALDREAPGPNAQGSTPLDLAAACGARLLNERAHQTGGFRVWCLGSVQRPLGGFAHGESGIACALLRLFGRTGDPELLAAAREGIAHERTLYTRDGQEWRLSWRPGTRFARSWCNGVPGIALGRLEMLDFESDPEALREIREALEITRSPELDDDDLLCCGNMGRVDVLLQAARKLHDESLDAGARALAGRVLERAEERGGFGLMASTRHLFDPRLFLGVSGIGYALLRLADPGLPCVLALD
jgi:type 2 lantibiotic biosynthesis protein LanM